MDTPSRQYDPIAFFKTVVASAKTEAEAVGHTANTVLANLTADLVTSAMCGDPSGGLIQAILMRANATYELIMSDTPDETPVEIEDATKLTDDFELARKLNGGKVGNA